MVETEVAAVEDADPVVEMWVRLAASQRTYGSHIPGETNRAQIRESVLRHIAGKRLLVARSDEILGFVMFSLEQGSFEQVVTRGLIENLYVQPDARHEGVGSTLLSSAENHLEKRGAETIALNVMATNEAARRFYRTHGYEPHRLELEKERLDEK